MTTKCWKCRKESLRRDARELINRAQAIDDAVYDLKAVNPNSIIEEDTRTPEDLLNIIEQKGKRSCRSTIGSAGTVG